jgi:hypothetical protein
MVTGPTDHFLIQSTGVMSLNLAKRMLHKVLQISSNLAKIKVLINNSILRNHILTIIIRNKRQYAKQLSKTRQTKRENKIILALFNKISSIRNNKNGV